MGLRRKITRTLVTVLITSQILCSHCTLRKLSKFPSNKRTKKEALGHSAFPANISEIIHFPSVVYPSNSEPEEYYRFLNEYPIQFNSINDIINYSYRGQKSKMETKCKRKLDMAVSTQTKPSLNKTYPEVYCFRRSDLFPEVEYPLSSRDLWLPNYMSTLQDVKINNELGIDTFLNKQTYVSNNDSNYEHTELNALIKQLNIKTLNDSEILNLSSNSLGMVNETTVSSDVATATTSPITNRFTSLDCYDSTQPIYFDIPSMSNVAPFEYMTSPRSDLTANTEFDQTGQYPTSHVTFTLTTTTPIPILTTNPPPYFNCTPSLPNLIVTDLCPQNLTEIGLGNLTKDWVLERSNDSYITCEYRDDADDWIIFVETGNTSVSLEDFSDKTVKVGADNYILLNYSEARNLSRIDDDDAVRTTPNIENVDNNLAVSSDHLQNNGKNDSCVTYTIMSSMPQDNNLNGYSTPMIPTSPTTPIYMDNNILNHNIQNTTQELMVGEYAPKLIVKETDTNEANNTIGELFYLDNSNSYLQYEYTDDITTSVTEIPYDLVLK